MPTQVPECSADQARARGRLGAAAVSLDPPGGPAHSSPAGAEVARPRALFTYKLDLSPLPELNFPSDDPLDRCFQPKIDSTRCLFQQS
jgi:hypothetical protein